MEKEIKEALNFAIGAAKSLREQADSILLKVEKNSKNLPPKERKINPRLPKTLENT